MIAEVWLLAASVVTPEKIIVLSCKDVSYSR